MKSIIFTAGILCATVASATCQQLSNGSVDCIGPVSVVYAEGSAPGILFQTAGDLTPVHCSLTSGVLWYINKSSPSYNELLQLVLIAGSTGQSLDVTTVSNISGQQCQIAYIGLVAN